MTPDQAAGLGFAVMAGLLFLVWILMGRSGGQDVTYQKPAEGRFICDGCGLAIKTGRSVYVCQPAVIGPGENGQSLRVLGATGKGSIHFHTGCLPTQKGDS